LNLVFSVSDLDTEINNLTITAQSSNPVLISNENLFVSGEKENKNLLIKPDSNKHGEAIISLIVDDGLQVVQLILFIHLFKVTMVQIILSLKLFHFLIIQMLQLFHCL